MSQSPASRNLRPVGPTVPPHLMGSRAGLFYLLRGAQSRLLLTNRVSPARQPSAPPRAASAPPQTAEARLQAALLGDVFVFGESA